jgi:hypothetical protein
MFVAMDFPRKMDTQLSTIYVEEEIRNYSYQKGVVYITFT